MRSAQIQVVVHIVDDDKQFQNAIGRLLRAGGYNVCGYDNAEDFLLADIDTVPGCILLDVCMPGPSGLELQEALAKRKPCLPIIFLSGRGDIPTSVKAIKAGAIDFLTKPVKREVLFGAIENALARYERGRIVCERITAWLKRYHALTARELEVFSAVVEGKRNKEIAGNLGMAERTVKAHRSHVMEKMGVSSVAELVHIADQLNDAGVVESAVLSEV